MPTLKQFMELVEFKLTEVESDSDYGPYTTRFTYWNKVQTGVSVSAVFDTMLQKIHELTVCDYTANKGYIWIDPENHVGEVEMCDGIYFTHLEIAEDFFEKAYAILNGIEYDTRIQVPLDLTEEDLFRLMREAHASDITLNQRVERILRKVIESTTK